MTVELAGDFEAFIAGADEELLREVLVEVEQMREPMACPVLDAYERLARAVHAGRRDVVIVQALLSLVEAGGDEAEGWLSRVVSTQSRTVSRATLERVVLVLDDPTTLAGGSFTGSGGVDLEVEDSGADLDELLDGELRAEAVAQMLEELEQKDPKSAMVLRRVYFEEMKLGEAGEGLNVVPERVRQIKVRGLEKARRLLDPELAA